MSAEPSLSVVVPTYNVGIYLDDLMRSILRQDIADLEVIVVDDGSTDDTVARAEAFAASDGRVSVHRSPGSGGGSARNFGVELATGGLLMFADGDDLVPDGAYAALVALMADSDVDIALGRYLRFGSYDSVDVTQNWPGYRQDFAKVTLADEPSLIRGRACWNKMFRRSLWNEWGVTFPDVPRSNDIVPMTTALLKARNLAVTRQPVYLYRVRPGAHSMTSKAGEATSLLSYLEQETICAELVRADPRGVIHDTYTGLLFDSDVRVHLQRYVEALTSEDRALGSDDALISAKVAGLVEAFPRSATGAWGRRRRMHFIAAVARGETAALADAGITPDAEVQPTAPPLSLDRTWNAARVLLGYDADYARTVGRSLLARSLEVDAPVDEGVDQEILAAPELHVILQSLPYSERLILQALLEAGAHRDMVRELMRHPAPVAEITASTPRALSITVAASPPDWASAARVMAFEQSRERMVPLSEWRSVGEPEWRVDVAAGVPELPTGAWDLVIDFRGADLSMYRPVLPAGRIAEQSRLRRVIASPLQRGGGVTVVVRRTLVSRAIRVGPRRVSLALRQAVNRRRGESVR